MSKRQSRRSRLRRLFYWCAVAGLWALIACGGVIVFVAANLPPIHSLEIPRRPPSIEIVGTDGKILATRGEMHGATLTMKDMPPYLPKAFLAIEDHRFFLHFDEFADAALDPIAYLGARRRPTEPSLVIRNCRRSVCCA